jgi:photosystem II stability/assembly factor-like uncharacterized protein
MNRNLKSGILFIQSISFVLLVYLGLYAQEGGQWDILNQGIDGSLNTIDFINENTGWITGYGGTLLKTEDGGVSWSSLPTEEKLEIEMIDFVNDSVGWAIKVQSQEEYDIYGIIHTQDGGQTWDAQYNSETILSSIYAVDDSVVYIIGRYGKILKTSDGGTNWIDISPNLTDKSLYSAWFIDAEVGLISGDFDDNSFILKTGDGGNTWDETIISEFNNIADLQFFNDSCGYFSASDVDHDFILCATTDTFNTWIIKSKVSSAYGSFHCLDEDIVYSITINGYLDMNIMKSIDGGVTWENKKRFYGLGGKIYVLNSNVVMYLNSGSPLPSLWRTTNGGDIWIEQIFSDPLNDVWFLNSQRGFACVGWSTGGDPRSNLDFGYLCFTDDGGKTWDQSIKHPNSMITSCFFINDFTGFTSSSDRYGKKYIHKTTDRGNNWTIVYAGYSCIGSDIYFANEQIGWVLCNSSILGTSDGGKSWKAEWKITDTDEFNYRLNSIHAVNTTAWAVGEYGMILKYTEQDQWQLQSSITDLPLNDVFFSDENHGWIAGGYFDDENEYLILLKTTDGGESWEEIPDFKYQINDMFFDNNLHGWAVGNDIVNSGEWWDPSYPGIILETEDGGDTWNIQVEGLSAPLNALHFKHGYCWAVGGYGLVLRTDGTNWVDQNTAKVYPNKFSLSQNYPNPFNPSTNIEFSLPKHEHVKIEVYNTLGQRIESLLNQHIKAGYHEVEFNAGNLSSGVYYYKIQVGEFQDVKKMILLR